MIKILNKKIQGPRRVIYYALITFFAYELLAKNFGLNQSFCYISEIISIIILIYYHPYKIKICKLELPFIIMITMYIMSIIGALLHSVNPFNYIFGFRGEYLSMVLLFASAAYLKIQDYHHIFHLFYKFQFLNIFFTLVQWLVYGYTEDLNNGAFTAGVAQDIFCGALMTYYFYAYHRGLVPLQKLLFILISCFFIAIIQDERFIFIEAGVILFYFSLANGFTLKKIVTSIIMLAAIIIAFNNLSESQAGTLNNINNAIDYAQQSGGWGYGLPRIGSSSIIQEKFFESPVEHILGIGLGSAIDNQFPFLDTSFFNKYRYLNFNWFSFQNLFLQTGWLGIILYVSFFGSLLIYNLRNKYKAPAQYRYLYDITITITLICILTIWYNATLRIFYATVPYVVLGLGPCVTHELVKRKKKNKV